MTNDNQPTPLISKDSSVSAQEQRQGEQTSGKKEAVSDDVSAVLQKELRDALRLAESEHAAEKLGGNIVKQEYWKGELAVLHRFRQLLSSPALSVPAKPALVQEDELRRLAFESGVAVGKVFAHELLHKWVVRHGPDSKEWKDCELAKETEQFLSNHVAYYPAQTLGEKKPHPSIAHIRQKWPEDAYVAWKQEHEDVSCDGGTHCAFMAGVDYAEEFLLSSQSNATSALPLSKTSPPAPTLSAQVEDQTKALDGKEADVSTGSAQGQNTLIERRSKFVYDAARLAAEAANAPIIPVTWSEREEPFKAQFREVIERQCSDKRSSSPEELHGTWMEAYFKMGWVYGPQYNREAKIHPDLVSYADLGQLERDKDAVFVALCEIARQWVYDNSVPSGNATGALTGASAESVSSVSVEGQTDEGLRDAIRTYFSIPLVCDSESDPLLAIIRSHLAALRAKSEKEQSSGEKETEDLG